MSEGRLSAALEYLEQGWSIIPIKPDTKRPAIEWREYQTRPPTEEEVTDWWTRWPEHDIAIVTGELSGIVIVDCDNEDAQHAAFDAGMRSIIKVKTKRGTHLYFKHPRDGMRRGPRAGSNVRTVDPDWPRIPGLDFRGDGSYALLPPSRGYSWDFDQSIFDYDEMPLWKDWRPSIPDEAPHSFAFSTLDLSSIPTLGPDGMLTEWERTAKFVKETFPQTQKIPTGLGNARNERVMRYISEQIMQGHFGAELRVRGYAFMNEFFVDQLPEREFEATVASMEQAEKRNHPERFTEAGEYIPRNSPVPVMTPSGKVVEVPARVAIQMKDAGSLISSADAAEYMIEPWLPRGTIVQVYGYSGHGKSLFVQHAMAALAAGQKYFGPFEIGGAYRVLYMDFENGMATIGRRLISMRHAHGDTADRLNIWAPFVGEKDINLNKVEGMLELKEWIDAVNPDVLIIDTIRSSFPGFQENSAESWATINTIAMRLRNSGISVVLMHHSNKPSEGSFGREAGSTNQLTVLETQIRIMQVFEDEESAKINAGLWDGKYERPVWPMLREKIPADYRLDMVMEVSYGKVREWTDLHDRVQWVGIASSLVGEGVKIVSSRSTKQRAKDMAIAGYDAEFIADRLSKPVRLIKQWLGIAEVVDE